MPRPDNYVCFMSVENPGQYISFRSNGGPGVPRDTREDNQDAQFFIRVEVRAAMHRHVHCTHTGLLCVHVVCSRDSFVDTLVAALSVLSPLNTLCSVNKAF